MSDKKIYKSVYTVTVLSAYPISAGTDIALIIREMDTGDLLGQAEEITLNEEIPADKAFEEQEALGNDGSFFESELEEDEDETPSDEPNHGD